MASNLAFDVVALDRASETFLKMATQVERLAARFDKLDGKTARMTLSVNDADANRGLDATEAKRQRLDGKKATVKVDAKVDKSFAEATVVTERFIGALATFAKPAAIVAAIPTVTALAGATVQLSGALGVIPAAGAAAAVTLGAVKIATSGFGDALKALAAGDMEKFNEQLSKMAPNAQAVLREYAGLQPTFTAIKLDVQTAFWAGLADKVRILASQYLPLASAALVDVAGSLNQTANGIFNYTQNSSALDSVRTIFANTTATMHELEPVGASIVSIFINIATVGSDFLPGLAAGFAEAANTAADFVAAARDSGQLHDWISNGLSILGTLIQTMIAVGTIMHNVWTAAGVDADGFMVSVRNAARVVADWTGSLQGQDAIGRFFQQVRDIVTALLPLLGALGVALFAAFDRVAPVLPDLIRGLTDVVVAAAPVSQVFGTIATILLGSLGPALSFLAPVLGPIVAGFIAWEAATKAWTIATAGAEIVQKAFNVATTIGEGIQLAYAVATDAGTRKLVLWSIATKAQAVAQGVLNAVMSLNPFTLVVIAIVALVAALVLAWNHSETFRAVVTAAWDGIKAAAGAAWEFLQGVFAAIPGVLASVGGFFTGLWTNYVQPAWDGIVAASSAAYDLLVSVLTTIGGAFTIVGDAAMALWQNYVQPAFDGIVAAGKLLFTILATVVIAPIVILMNIMQATFDGLRDVAIAAFHVISEEAQIWWGVLAPIWQAVVDFLSGVMSAVFNAFRDVAVAVFTTISEEVGIWWGVVSGLWNTAVTFLSGVFTATFNAFRDAVLLVWRTLQEELQIWWDFALGLWNTIINFLSGPFTSGYNTFMAVVTALWEGLKNYLSAWWNEKLAQWNSIIAYLSGVFTNAYNSFINTVTSYWETFKSYLSAWWQFILANVWQPIVNYVIGPFVNGFNVMRDAVTSAWNALRDGIVAVWNAIRASVFDPIVNFVTVTIPNAFNSGVAAIRRVWDGVRAAMRDPIQAAINVVYNNGIVWVFNKVAETVGISNRLSPYTLPAFAGGGPIRGGIPGKDSVPILAQQGEYVFSKPAVDAAGGVASVDALHRALAAGPSGRGGVHSGYQGSAYDDAISINGLPPFATGGSVGGATGSGSASTVVRGSVTATTPVGSFLSDVWDKATGFVSDLAGRVGGTPWGQLAVGLGRKAMDMIVEWGKKKIADWLATFAATSGSLGPGSQNFGTGQVAQMMAILHGPFPGLGLISGYRPGARVAGSGNQSYHAVGRAVDIPPRWDVFNWIRANYMAKTRELIFSPANGMQIWNGRNYMFTGVTRANHFNHVHWAYANGGIVDRPTFGLLGEAGPEVVLPLNRPQRAQELAEQAGIGSGGGFHVHVTAGPTASAEDLIRSAMHQARLARISGRYARGRG